MTLNAGLAATATLIALAFGLSTWDRWLRRRRPHELAWTISLLLFAIGAGSLWWAESRGWSLLSFRLFFLTGAVLNVPWLALGTVYLLLGPRIGRVTRSWVVALSAFAIGAVLTAPTKTQIVSDEFPTAKEVFGVAPRVLAAVGSAVPALFIIGGAIWSAIQLLRSQIPVMSSQARRTVSSPKRLVIGNLLIATGTLILSASGTMSGRLGKDRSFAVTLLVGISVLFVGFLVATPKGQATIPTTQSHSQ